MEVHAKSPLFALICALVAIGLIAFSSLVLAAPLYFILCKLAVIASCKKNFIIVWAVITLVRSSIPSRKTQTINIEL